MKITFETAIPVPMETVWNTLMDFSRYPEWNPVFIAVEGVAAPDAVLNITVKLSGQVPRKMEVQVSGCAPPKYFSFENKHRFGAWFLQQEWIFRMKERDDGVLFIAEVYVTGLGLRFRRSKIENALRRSATNLVYDLKEQIGR